MGNTKLCAALISGLAILSTSNIGYAEENLSTQKLEFIQQQFQQNKDYSQLWQYGWLGVFSASAAVNGVLWSESSSRKEKFASKVGFITSALGVGDMLVNPMPTHGYAEKMTEQQIELTQAEQWLADAAAKEQYQRSFINHLLSGVVAVASGVAIAKNDHHKTSDGIVTFATNFIASEAKIWTAPTHMTRAWSAYQSGNIETAQYHRYRPKEQTSWQLAAAGPVLHLQYQF